MDARIDTEELVGDTRKYYYVIRTAGSALAEKELDMLELAVANGVETILLTRHTDCAAEKVAADPHLRARYPHLVAAIDGRDAIDKALLARPGIADKLRKGALTVRHMHIDTATDAMREDTALR
jgi:carbonic anhydrase